MSGIGQNHGTPGLREMSRQRFVSFDANSLEAPLGAYPYDETSNRILTSGIEHLHGRGRWGRFRAMLRLLRTKRFRERVHTRSLVWSGKRHIK